MRISDWSSDVCSSDLVARHEEEIMFDRGRGEESVDDWRSLPGPALDVARDPAPAENDGVIDREQPVTETVRRRIARGHITGASSSEESGGGKEWVRTCGIRGQPDH